jgi:hypothetical protein
MNIYVHDRAAFPAALFFFIPCTVHASPISIDNNIIDGLSISVSRFF